MSDKFESSIFANCIFEKENGSFAPLNMTNSRILREKAKYDAKKLLYYSLITYSDALMGFEKARYSWSIIKLYYCTFFSIRSILCNNGKILFHHTRKPLELDCQPGQVPGSPPRGVRSSTHKWVFHTFRNDFRSNPLLSQQIDGIDPFRWLTHLREEVNYKRAMCYEPVCPKIFGKMKQSNVRSHITQYAEDPALAFDPDHAIFAFPLYALTYAVNSKRSDSGFKFEKKKVGLIDSYLVDRKGKIPYLLLLKDRISNS